MYTIVLLINILIIHTQSKAAVLPRIMPSAGTLILDDILVQLETDLDFLLSNKANITIDNAPPLYFGFSHGHTLC